MSSDLLTHFISKPCVDVVRPDTKRCSGYQHGLLQQPLSVGVLLRSVKMAKGLKRQAALNMTFGNAGDLAEELYGQPSEVSSLSSN